MIEQWKDIKGYEGIYRISNCGNLLSSRSGRWRVLSNINKKGGYLSVVLYDKVKNKYSTRLHRLVYEAFVGNIPDGFVIHHIDGNKQNNHLENLVMMLKKEHRRGHIERNPMAIEGMRTYNKYVRPNTILQCSLDGRFIDVFPNAKEASRQTGVCSRNILQVANKTEWKPGKVRKQAGGYLWKIV